MTTYSNPRTEATIPDWPSGKHRVTAVFTIERDHKRGDRAVRTTTGAPKKLTYARKARIVDGDDGRVYILELSPFSRHITVMRGTMDYNHEVIYERDDRYEDIRKLFGEE
jgi:hypothetical protein